MKVPKVTLAEVFVQGANKVLIFLYPFLLYRALTVSRFPFSLDLYTIGRTPWTSDLPVARPLPKYWTTQTQKNARARARAHTHTHTHTPNIHVRSGIRAHDHSVRASEDSSCLRPRCYCDRLGSERAKTVHTLDRLATVTD
jgi:hypothetical protein